MDTDNIMLLEHFTFGPLRVLVDASTGAVVAVQDALTGCAASLLYSKASIASAIAQARMAFESTHEPA